MCRSDEQGQVVASAIPPETPLRFASGMVLKYRVVLTDGGSYPGDCVPIFSNSEPVQIGRPPDADCDGSPADRDCDDLDASRFPGRHEDCSDGLDNDCDVEIDETSDADGDGVENCSGDCNCPTAFTGRRLRSRKTGARKNLIHNGSLTGPCACLTKKIFITL